MSSIYIGSAGNDNYEIVDLTAEEEQELLDEKESLKAEYTEPQYKLDRQLQYPSIQDQLDMQYWDSVNGTTVWADTIAQVKADNPKPE